MTLPRAARLSGQALCLALLAAVPRPSHGAAPGALAVSVLLEPVEIRVGDVARLTVTVEHPAAAALALPEIERGRAIQVIDRQRATAPLKGRDAAGRERTTFIVSLTSFEVGEHGLGGGTMSGTDGAGAPLAAPLPATVLRTRSLLAGESTPMRGAREPLRWPDSRRRWMFLGAGMLLLAVALLAGVRRLRPVRRSPPACEKAPLAPHERALQALAALRRREPSERDPIERHFRDLSAIVRRYLEERFGLRAPERTTEELAREAAASGKLAPVHQELVRAFLSGCDLVKFARHRAGADDLSKALAAAERLVRETRPAVAQAPSRGSKGAGR